MQITNCIKAFVFECLKDLTLYSTKILDIIFKIFIVSKIFKNMKVFYFLSKLHDKTKNDSRYNLLFLIYLIVLYFSSTLAHKQ